jgi:5'-nucleotidase
VQGPSGGLSSALNKVSCRFLPDGMKWRDLFDIVIVQARKPSFWGDGTVLTEIVSDDGLMKACHTMRKGGRYYGGSAKVVQDALGLNGDHFLYVGGPFYHHVVQI